MAEQNLQTINVSEEQNQQEVSDIKMAEQNPQTTNAGEEQNQQQEVSTITDTKEPVKMDVCEEQTQQEVSTTTHAKEPKEEDTKQNPEDNVEKVEGRKVTVEDGSEETSVKEHGPDKNANDATTSPNDPVEIVPTKKKKKRKKKKKSGIDELDLHDMGPIEADEDKLYESSKPLTHRIEEAIQRYRKNRKFPPIRNQVFTSYLRFGGISTGQKAFLTQDGAENEDEDAQDIAARRSTDYIEEEDDDVEVDFTYTARVYLSGYLIDKSGYVQMEQFVEAPQVVISFLNYLRNHKVCPEHEDDMQGALQIAQKAAIELPKCKALAHNAPGKFHKACSLLFGGELYGVLDDPWNGEEKVAMMIGISKGEGRRLITKVFGANAFEELERVEKDTKQTLSCEVVEVVESEQSKGKENSVKNTEVVEPSQSTNGTQSSAEKNSESPKSGNDNKQVNNETGNANAENDSEDDAINFKRVILRGRSERDTETFHVNIDSNLAENVLPGMLITADFHRLSNGFWYWDKVTNVYPSYYLECEDDSDDDDY